MNTPLVFSCILLTILGTAHLTNQKSVRSSSEEGAVLRPRQPRTAEEAPTVPPTSDHLVSTSPTPLKDYPKDNITDLPKNQRPSSNLLLGHFYAEGNADEVNNRTGDETEKLCVSRTQIVFPREEVPFALKKGQFRQGFRAEICDSSANRGGCRIPGVLTIGYTSYCKQNYAHHTLLMVNTNSSTGEDGFITKSFMLPSWCSCEIVRDLTGSERQKDQK